MDREIRSAQATDEDLGNGGSAIGVLGIDDVHLVPEESGVALALRPDDGHAHGRAVGGPAHVAVARPLPDRELRVSSAELIELLGGKRDGNES